MTFLRRPALLLLLVALNGCSHLTQTVPVAPPAPTDKAQEITRAQTSTLTKIGNVTADVIGSPMDAEAEIQRKADAAGARYYVIMFNSETIMPGRWYSQAILYR
ncbi:biofilm peroxide resistance protein BsmA [Rahnella sp. C60]|uniref:Biofilm peroxide resistance protein BsmA n=1 Tax=Rahnella perminowiae TaxID=2816244 RepID=A0ABS6L0Z1_9GAMM|nr:MULTISPECIES: biofilm peroxide resistance protein BsmA [Rahnella]UJD87774.1 biofilm peroxide resistance protein BsmA [Rahnella aquatilis]MBU9811787.1 biofilm peroxide resistance protein BsmA [Rahnella perminowiae]MBU9814826.1 biofilm peroxide resistance protein BsmA [Rahnella perminowiae]MBU9827091.1 biofilm peroxide resistance protein BsmA [Rahnella perminowiae]MBU9835249.1 biofilm peroxide resistance protein BsmA [Rahnella perminowiae]